MVEPETVPTVGCAQSLTMVVLQGIWSVTRRCQARASDVLRAVMVKVVFGYADAATSPGTGMARAVELALLVRPTPGKRSMMSIVSESVAVAVNDPVVTRMSLLTRPGLPALNVRSWVIHG